MTVRRSNVIFLVPWSGRRRRGRRELFALGYLRVGFTRNCGPIRKLGALPGIKVFDLYALLAALASLPVLECLTDHSRSLSRHMR